MSVDVTSVPMWKQTLLDKKRRQNEESRRSEEEEVNKISSLPNWKKDLLLKRQTQNNSLVFIGREKHNDVEARHVVENSICDKEQGMGQVNHSEGDQTVPHKVVIVEPCDSDLSSVASERKVNNSPKEKVAEHLLPVKQNPWLRSDRVRQKHGQKRFSDSNMLRDTYSSERHAVNHTSWSGEIDIMKESKQDAEDNVFEEEVAYGKGFVHKLLRRFSRYSSPEDCERGRKSSRTSSSKRCHSAENLLDDSRSHSPISPRDYSNSYTDSVSPRSPTRSRSTESIPSPRSPNDASTHLDSKMGVTDKSGVGTSVYDSRDSSQNSSLLSPSWENISDAEDGLPKKNTVASARNVFEKIVGPVKSEKIAKPLAPRPIRSPRNSVHTLIAVGDKSSTDESTKTTVIPSSESSDKAVSSENCVDTRSVRFDAKPVQKDVDNSRNTAPSLVANSEIISKSVGSRVHKSQVEPSLKSSKINETGHTVEKKSSSINADQSSGQSYFDLYFNNKSQSSNSESSSSMTITDTANGVLLNGDIGESSTEDTDKVVVIPTSQKSEPSFKKRKAPPPPKPSLIQDRVKSSSEDSSSKVVNGVMTNGVVNENGPILNVSHQKQNSKPVNTTPKPLSAKPVYNQSKPVSSQQKQTNVSHNESSVSETKRPNLNLNLNEITKKPEVVKSSRGSSNDAYSVINNRANKKAKIVTPKSSGPGSLLIRPASNMIQAKNAQFAKLEFKYEDIRSGEFAPPKKKPAYYDDDSSDEDIPVTNIDDIDDTIDDVRGRRDRNANIAKKAGKYEFIGAGVISGKSSLSKRHKEVKTSIRFTDQSHSCYEYPSEQSLMADVPARPGDYDFFDETMTNGRDDSDDDDDVMTLEVETVQSANLKNSPAVGHSGPLSGYQSKMQFEYHFGMNMQDDEPPPVTRQQRVPSVEEQDYLHPADEVDTAQWSQTATSDLLF